MERYEVLVVGSGPVATTLVDELTERGIGVRSVAHVGEVGRLDQDSSEVAGTVGGTELRAAYVVGTDDARTAIRDRLGTNEPYRRGRAFFAGDGGVEDANNLGWKLAATLRGAGDELLLDSYAEERQAVTASNQRGVLDRLLRRTGRAHYRGCRLSQHLGGKHPLVRAGDPVPDVRLWSIADDAEYWLSELRTREWTVLGLGSASAQTVSAAGQRFGAAVRGEVVGGGTGRTGAPGVTLVDRRGEARQRLGRRGGTVLVIRPDGYIGLVALTRAELVQAYLEDLIPPDPGTHGPAATFSKRR